MVGTVSLRGESLSSPYRWPKSCRPLRDPLADISIASSLARGMFGAPIGHLDLATVIKARRAAGLGLHWFVYNRTDLLRWASSTKVSSYPPCEPFHHYIAHLEPPEKTLNADEQRKTRPAYRRTGLLRSGLNQISNPCRPCRPFHLGR